MQVGKWPKKECVFRGAVLQGVNSQVGWSRIYFIHRDLKTNKCKNKHNGNKQFKATIKNLSQNVKVDTLQFKKNSKPNWSVKSKMQSAKKNI